MFFKNGTFNEASDPQTLYFSKIRPILIIIKHCKKSRQVQLIIFTITPLVLESLMKDLSLKSSYLRVFFIMLSAEFLVYGFSLFPFLFIKNDFTDDIPIHREKNDDKIAAVAAVRNLSPLFLNVEK